VTPFASYERALYDRVAAAPACSVGERPHDGTEQWATVHLPRVHGAGDDGVELGRPERKCAPDPVVADDLGRREAVTTESKAEVVLIALWTGLPSSHLVPRTGAYQLAPRERSEKRGEVRCVAHQPTAGPIDRRIHVGDVLPVEVVGRDIAAAGCLTAALQPCVSHAGRVEHQIALRLVERPAGERFDDEAGEHEPGVGVRAGCPWRRRRGSLATARFTRSRGVNRRRPPPCHTASRIEGCKK